MGELLTLLWEYIKIEIIKYPLFLLSRWKVLLAAILSAMTQSRVMRQNWKFMVGVCAVQILINVPVLFSGADIWTKLEAVGLIIWGILLGMVFWKEKDEDEMEITDGNGNKVKIKKAEFFQKTKERAAKGNCAALYDLGICYRSGIGTKVDYKEAKKCFTLLLFASTPEWQNRGKEQLEKTRKIEEEEIKRIAEHATEGFAGFLGFETED